MTQTPTVSFLPADTENARVFTINFASGGALTASKGLLDLLFSSGSVVGGSCGAPSKEKSVRSHSRTRIIGEPATNVAGSTYTYKAYPVTPKLARSGGEPIKIRVGGEWWTARLSGSHQEFMAWLCDNQSLIKIPALYWRSEHGTNYGPVGPGAITPPA